METHIFRLLTGVECEIQGILGEHQEIMTSQKNIKDGTSVNKFLKEIVVRLGSKDHITEKDIENLLSGDRRAILLELRNFENEFDTNFEFNYKFSSEGKTLEHPVEIDFKDVERKPYRLADGTAIECTEYSEVLALKKQGLTLPSGLEIFFEFLDGEKETQIAKMGQKQVTILTDISVRRPRYQKDGHEITLDVKRQRAKDLNSIRKAIKEREGDIDTMVQFNDPYTGQTIRFDAMYVSDFLFPGLT